MHDHDQIQVLGDHARLHAGGPILVVEHEVGATLDLMTVPLGSADGVRLQVVRPYLGEALPGDASQLAGLVVLGGEMGALDDDVAPWLPAVRALMADAVRRATPSLGICLGAQLLAAATGGTVERGDAGLELGLVPVRPAAAAVNDPYLARVLSLEPAADGVVQVLQYHRDVVSTLPPDAELLVTGDRYPQQAFRVGPAAWAVQYHPEVSAGMFSAWLESAAIEDPEAHAAAVAGIRASPGLAGRQRLADAHALGLLSAATFVS